MANEKKKGGPRRMHLFRRLSQGFFLVAMNPYFFVYHGFCFPAMNCWACPAAAFGCPIGAIGNFLAIGLVPFLAIGLIALAGAFLGRFICGWVCPFGFLQDLMAKIPIPGRKKNRRFRFPPALGYLKYAFLVITVLWIPVAYGTARNDWKSGSDYFFCNICPAGTLEAAIPVRIFGPRVAAPDPEQVASTEDAAAGAGAGAAEGGVAVAADLLDFLLFSPRIWILYGFLALFILFRRPFCRGMCPIGAVFALLNRASLLRMRVDKETCKSCGVCEKKCPADNHIQKAPSAQDCIRCFECVDNCSKKAVKIGAVAVAPRESYWE